MRKSIYSAAQAHLGTLLVAAREKAGLKQQEVADRLGRPQSFVSKYEAGQRRLDVMEFITVARALGADPVSLIRQLIAKKRL